MTPTDHNDIAPWPDTRDLSVAQAVLRVGALAVLGAVGWVAGFAVLGLFVELVVGLPTAAVMAVAAGGLYVAWRIGSR